MKKTVLLFCMMLTLSIQITFSGQITPEDGKATVNGIKIYYKIIGSGDPIFVLHGGPGMFHDYFLPSMNELAGQYKLIFYDQRGNGGSPIEVSSETYTFELLVKDLDELRKSLGFSKIHLMGHSFGGYLAMRYAIRHSANLKSLLLVTSAPSNFELFRKSLQNRISRYSEAEREQIQSMNQILMTKPDPEMLKSMLLISEKVSIYDPDQVSKVMDQINFTPDTTRNLIAVSRLQGQLFSAYDIDDQLERISVPTLIIAGEKDFIVSESARAIQQKIRNSRIETIQKSGHYPFIENPNDFFKVVRSFLASIK